ncbi:MAG: hypothetical protein J0M07_20755 [Anaerolineae bacterium]|nr:hypothetical protein [Anaerolineae bacterium]
MENYTIIVAGQVKFGKLTFLQHIGDYPVISFLPPFGNRSLMRIPIDADLDLYIGRVPESGALVDFMHVIMQSAIGFIVFVDSSAPERFREARGILGALLAHYFVPLIVAANKQDLPEAWSPEDLRIALRIPKSIPIVPCVATDHASVRQVLLTLLGCVLAESE